MYSHITPHKSINKKHNSSQAQISRIKKWQSDASIFLAQLEKEQTVDTTIWENDLVIGNLDAPIMITVVCNPYCGPCAKAHKELDEILDRFKGKVKVQLRLLCNPKNAEDIKTIAVKAILQQAAFTKSNNDLQTMLSDWFEWMSYDKWICKWNTEEQKDVKTILLKHAKWVNENNVTHTPTFFVNGKKLPGRYHLKNLEKLIPQLAEKIKIL